MENPLRVPRQDVLRFQPHRPQNVKNPNVSVLTTGGDDVRMPRGPAAPEEPRRVSVDPLDDAVLAKDDQARGRKKKRNRGEHGNASVF